MIKVAPKAGDVSPFVALVGVLDVLFLLVFFLLAAGNFIRPPVVEALTTGIISAQAGFSEMVVVVLERRGRIIISGKIISPENEREELRKIIGDRRRTVLIAPHAGVDAQRLVEVAELLGSRGHRVVVASTKNPSGEARLEIPASP